MIGIKLHAGLKTMNFHLYCQPSYSSGVNTGAGVRTVKKSFKTLADMLLARGNFEKRHGLQFLRQSPSDHQVPELPLGPGPDSAVSSPILEGWP